MKGKAVVCLAKSTAQAEVIVRNLKEAGFTNDAISVLYADKSGTSELAHENKTKAPEGAAAGASTGGVLGGGLGLLLGVGALAIPGLGPFIAAGPIMAALGGAAVGATVGGITGALVGMGIPEYEAKVYETKLRGGSVLISVHADDEDDEDRAKDVYENAGAEDIKVTSEKELKK
jgi:hypothetical protein